MPAHSTATAAQAWAILSRHARDEIAPLRLQELCRDNDRVSSLVAVYNTASSGSGGGSSDSNEKDHHQPNHMLIADLSRQRMTLETLTHLLKLASARGLRQFITQLAWGQNDPRRPIVPQRARLARSKQKQQQHQHHHPKRPTPSLDPAAAARDDATSITTTTSTVSSPSLAAAINAASSSSSPSMHMALRVPAGQSHEMLLTNGTNALDRIHQEWERIQHRIANPIRKGLQRGASGSMIRDVVVIGRGVPMAALHFVYQALLRDERAVAASRADLIPDAPAARIRQFVVGGVSGGVGNNIMGGTNSSSSLFFGPFSSTLCRRLFLLTRVDPVAVASVVEHLDPATTLVISIALQGNEETGLATKALKSWLLQALSDGSNSNSTSSGSGSSNRRPDYVLAKHMMLVTGNDRIASVINKPESVHIIPEHSRCEAFSTFSATMLLPLSIVFGWSIVEDLLAGAHDMDTHFVETNPRHNIPVLLALVDIWNDTLLGASARVVTPFSEAFSGFPAFVAALEAQSCSRPMSNLTDGGGGGNGRNAAGNNHRPPSSRKATCTSLVLDGGVNGTYDRSLYQSQDLINSELVAVMDSQVAFNASRTIGTATGMEDIHTTEDAVLCSIFAHCDELAFGSEKAATENSIPTPASSTYNHSSSVSSPYVRPYDGETSEGNRPSTVLMCGKLDAFACGQLIALAEHRAVVKAHIWGIDPFVREVGSSLRMYRSDVLKDELQLLFLTKKHQDETAAADEEVAAVASSGSLNLSTKTILEHYATQMRDSRIYTVK